MEHLPVASCDTVMDLLYGAAADRANSRQHKAWAFNSRANEPSAEGLYGKPKCPSGPASQAAANLSTTTR